MAFKSEFPTLTAKEVVGLIYNQLEATPQMEWVAPVSMKCPSDSAQEKYAWLGQAPGMREWIGDRIIAALRENSYTLKNKLFESTIGFSLEDLRRDKIGQTNIRIAELAVRAQAHWASLLSTLILNAETWTCYDGQAFFSAAHTEGASGTQTNLVTATQCPALNVTTATAPTAAEMAAILPQVFGYFQSLLDDQGQPMNEGAAAFQVQCGTVPIYDAVFQACNNDLLIGGATISQGLSKRGMKIQPVFNARLSTLTTQLIVSRTDTTVKPFIRQSEYDPEVQTQAEGSAEEFHNNRWLFGLKASRNVGFGLWQYCLKCTMS